MLLTPINYEKLNQLPTDKKLSIIRALKLVEETRKRMKEQGVDVSLPYRMQLKNDCEDIERRIKTFEKGKIPEAKWSKFENRVEILLTESEHILMWTFEDSSGDT